MNKKNEQKSLDDLYRSGKYYLYADHSRPKTRRDFLRAGVISSAGYVLTPSLLSLLLKAESAHAGGICEPMSPNPNRPTPFMLFDFAGGAPFVVKNFVAGGSGGQQDQSFDDEYYRRFGMVTGAGYTSSMSNSLGLLSHAQSPLVLGIEATCPANVRAKINGALLCARSANDTGTNRLVSTYMIRRAQETQGLIADILGTDSGQSLVQSSLSASSYNSSYQAVRITNESSATGLVSFGDLSSDFAANPDKVKKVMNFVKKMSASRLAQFNSKSMIDQVKELVACQYMKTEGVANGEAEIPGKPISPSADTVTTSIFNNASDINPLNGNPLTINGDGTCARVATIANMLFNGYSNVGSVTQGGFDYHGANSVNEQSVRDRHMGMLIGRCFALAAAKGQDLMVKLITDGGLSCGTTVPEDGIHRTFNSDNSNGSAVVLLVYKHQGSGRVGTTQGNGGDSQAGAQIGHMTSAGTSNDAHLISNNSDNVCHMTALAYLALHNETGKFSQLFSSPFKGIEGQNRIFQALPQYG